MRVSFANQFPNIPLRTKRCLLLLREYLSYLPYFAYDRLIAHPLNKYRAKKQLRDQVLTYALIPSRVLGTFAHYSEYFIRYCLVHNIDLKTGVLFVCQSGSANAQLLTMLQRVVDTVVDDQLWNMIYNGGHHYLRSTDQYIGDRVPEELKNGKIFYPQAKQSFSLTQSEIKYGWQLLRRIDIPYKSPLVCISCKDQNYYRRKHGAYKHHDNYRDTDFSDLSDSISYLTSRGISVLRCGHYPDANDRLSYKSLNSFTDQQRQFLDIFVQHECLFSICGDSGLAFIPYLFKKIILYHNFIPLNESPTVERGIILPKLLRSRTTNQIVSIRQMLSTTQKKVLYERGRLSIKNISMDSFQDQHLYDLSGVDVIDNSPQELLKATEETYLHSLGKLELSNTDLYRQKMFKSLFPISHPMRLSPDYIVSPSFLSDYAQYLMPEL